MSEVDGFQVGDEGLLVIGLSVCWEDKDAYFISLQKDVKDGKCSQYGRISNNNNEILILTRI